MEGEREERGKKGNCSWKRGGGGRWGGGAGSPSTKHQELEGPHLLKDA